jgi:hypothetical protein
MVEVLAVGKGKAGQGRLDEATITEVPRGAVFYRSMAGHPLAIPGTTNAATTVPPGGLVFVGDPAVAAELRSHVADWRAVPLATVIRAVRNGEPIIGWSGTVEDLKRAASRHGDPYAT